MSLCQAKRGFFTLYDCPKAASKTCEGCSRSLCNEHIPEAANICLECAARTKSADEDISVRSYQTRHKSLLKQKKSNIYFGKDLTDYYDKYDLRAFDIELSNIGDMADSPDEIFFDS